MKSKRECWRDFLIENNRTWLIWTNQFLDFQGIFVIVFWGSIGNTSPLNFEKNVPAEFLHPAFRDAFFRPFWSKASQRHHQEVLQHEVRCQMGGALLKLGKVHGLEDQPRTRMWLIAMVTLITYELFFFLQVGLKNRSDIGDAHQNRTKSGWFFHSELLTKLGCFLNADAGIKSTCDFHVISMKGWIFWLEIRTHLGWLKPRDNAAFRFVLGFSFKFHFSFHIIIHHRSTTKCLQTIIFVCLKRRPYYIISYNKLVISQENHVGALVSFGHESIRWPRCRSEQVTLVLWCFFRGDEILPSYITPWKTNERPLKINGCFRCISYWNSPLFRGTC